MHNDPRSHGLWERTAPPAPETGILTSDIRTDVAVIGAGYTGLSAALHLAASGCRVAVLEGREIGFGGSGRNVGLVNAGMWVMPDDLPAILGEEYGPRLLNLLGAAPDLVFKLIAERQIACEAQRNGTLHLAVGRSGLAELSLRAEQWTRRGAPVTLLDAQATAALVGSGAYASALLDQRAGTIQPLAYARGLARAAIEAGALVFTQSQVRSASPAGSGWRLASDSGYVTADWVVVASNAYTETTWQQIRNEIVVLPYFNFATQPLPPALQQAILPQRQGCWDTAKILSSFRFDAAGRLVFGSVGALRGTGIAVHRAWARRALRRVFPALGEVTFEAEWYGRIGMTGNALPRFHRLAPRAIGCSGYNGRGIAPGTVFGKMLADFITGDIALADLPLPASPIQPAPFRQFREAWYEAGAQVAHLLS